MPFRYRCDEWAQKHDFFFLYLFRHLTAEEESNSVKLQEEMMYQRSEHAVAIETLKADYENLLERTSTELKVKHEGEIALGRDVDGKRAFARN